MPLDNPGGFGEGHIVVLSVNYDSIGQGTWGLIIAGTGILNYEFVNSSDANLDDAVQVGSVDKYNAGTIMNQVYSVTGIVITAPGLKTFKIRLDGKHGASIGHKSYSSVTTFWRTK